MDNVKKKRIKQYTAWIALAVLVALLAAMPLLARSEAEADGPTASILSGTVQMGSVETGLRGGGTLSAGSAMDVELPSGVKITEFLVRNGDTVEAGDPVAVVDSVSVMTAIVQVRDTMEYLREEMEDARDESAASTVKATAGGRVKQIYAAAGDSVQDVMLRHGALAVLSLDGKMAVELVADTALAAGDSVSVVFDDGTGVSGRVESNLDSCLVVTVDDGDYEVGTAVTVRKDGTAIGTGELYVHNAWKATAFTGTVSTVSARENTDVYSGSTLFTLKDTDYTGTLDSLASLHREYEELLQKLFAMYESEVITAPCGGKISGVEEDSEYLLAAIDGEQGWFVDLLDAPGESKGWTVRLLSNEESECTGREDCEAQKHDSGCAVYCTGLSDCSNENHKTGCLGVCTGDGATCQSIRSHEHHEKTCVKRCTGQLDCDANQDAHQDACIERCECSDDDSCPALNHKEGCWFHGVTYTAYAAKLTLVGSDSVQAIPGGTQYTVEPDGSGWKLVEPSEIQDQFPGMTGVAYEGPVLPEGCAAGDIILIVTGKNGEGQSVYYGASVYQKARTEDASGTGTYPGLGDLGGLLGGMGGMSGMAGLYGSTQTTGYELYELEGNVLMTVTEQDSMTLSITVDEQDITRLTPGQSAQVKVGPLKGRTFEAEVTEIGVFGTSSGGSSKFTVELTLPMDADMLSGMSATAYIPLYTKMDVLTVPVAALVEEGGRTLIYTALDPESGEPASAVEVTTGISDGEVVEILSGLESGSPFYYSYYDTLELSTDVETDKYSFG